MYTQHYLSCSQSHTCYCAMIGLIKTNPSSFIYHASYNNKYIRMLYINMLQRLYTTSSRVFPPSQRNKPKNFTLENKLQNKLFTNPKSLRLYYIKHTNKTLLKNFVIANQMYFNHLDVGGVLAGYAVLSYSIPFKILPLFLTFAYRFYKHYMQSGGTQLCPFDCLIIIILNSGLQVNLSLLVCVEIQAKSQ